MSFEVHDPDFLVFEHLLPQDAVIVDVGANAGQSIKSFKSILRDCEIHSFEPNQEFHEVLRPLSLETSGLYVYLWGLSDKPGRTQFFIPVVDGLRCTQEASMDLSEFDKPWVRSRLLSRGTDLRFEIFEADLSAGDQFGFKPDLIKIDVEGAELAVIKGFGRTIQVYQPYVLAENSDGARCVAYMRELGYLPCMPDESYTCLVPFGGPARANTVFVPDRFKRLIRNDRT